MKHLIHGGLLSWLNKYSLDIMSGAFHEELPFLELVDS